MSTADALPQSQQPLKCHIELVPFMNRVLHHAKVGHVGGLHLLDPFLKLVVTPWLPNATTLHFLDWQDWEKAQRHVVHPKRPLHTLSIAPIPELRWKRRHHWQNYWDLVTDPEPDVYNYEPSTGPQPQMASVWDFLHVHYGAGSSPRARMTGLGVGEAWDTSSGGAWAWEIVADLEILDCGLTGLTKKALKTILRLPKLIKLAILFGYGFSGETDAAMWRFLQYLSERPTGEPPPPAPPHESLTPPTATSDLAYLSSLKELRVIDWGQGIDQSLRLLQLTANRLEGLSLSMPSLHPTLRETRLAELVALSPSLRHLHLTHSGGAWVRLPFDGATLRVLEGCRDLRLLYIGINYAFSITDDQLGSSVSHWPLLESLRLESGMHGLQSRLTVAALPLVLAQAPALQVLILPLQRWTRTAPSPTAHQALRTIGFGPGFLKSFVYEELSADRDWVPLTEFLKQLSLQPLRLKNVALEVEDHGVWSFLDGSKEVENDLDPVLRELQELLES